MINLKAFLTKESFAEKIEEKVLNEDMTYFEAVVDFAAECDKSPEELLPFMSQVILDKVKKSAQDAGLAESTTVNIEDLMG